MKLVLGMVFILYTKLSVADPFVVVGQGAIDGDGWSGSMTELGIGYAFSKQWNIESSWLDLGERDEWRDDKIRGLSIEGKYYQNFGDLKLSYGIGPYIYSSDYSTGDAGYKDYSIGNSASMAAGYSISDSVLMRLKASKIFLDNASGDPNYLTLGVVYSF